MDKQFQRLKESMDDTVLREIQMNKKLKGRILKDISKENAKQQVQFGTKRWNKRAIFASIAALFLLFIITASMLNQQTTGYGKRYQQVELLKMQSDIISILKTQVKIEKELIHEINSKDYTVQELNKLKVQAANNSLSVSKQIENFQIPLALTPYKQEINESLSYLRKSYFTNSNEIMDLEKWVKKESDIHLPPEQQVSDSDHYFFKFEQKLHNVYDDLGLLRSSYLYELQRDINVEETSYNWFKRQYHE